MKRMLSKHGSVLVALLLVLFAFAGCTSPGTGTTSQSPAQTNATQNTPDTAPAASPEAEPLKYQGKITMEARSYNPVDPTDTNPNPPTMIKKLAQKYSELHPGIEIEFMPDLGGQDYSVWLKTKIAGGMAPDIIWGQWFDLNSGTIPYGSVIDLNDYLKKPNPYYTGAATWGDMFYPDVQAQIAGPNGEHYNIDGDYVATAVIYNEALFAKAGITSEPTNWSEFTEDCKKLQSTGVIPWGYSFGNDGNSVDRMTWLAKLFYTNFYANDFKEMAVCGSTSSLNTTEVMVAFKKGLFGPKDPRWLGWWDLIKQQIPMLQKDSTSAATNTTAISNMFINQDIAMEFEGSWAGRSLDDAKVEFEYSSFPFPPPDSGCSQYATDFNSSGAVGGPNAAFQYAISSSKADQSMTQDKQDTCADWLMFITTPENNAAIVNELGSFVPLVKGAQQLPQNESLVKMFESQPLCIDGGLYSGLSTNTLDTYYRTFQQYLAGTITLQDAADTLQPIVDQDVDAKIQSLGIDISQYLK